MVKYEDLLLRTEEQMKTVRDSLGIADSEGLLVPTLCGQPCAANSSYDIPFCSGVVQEPSTGCREQRLTALEAAALALITGRIARRFGYA